MWLLQYTDTGIEVGFFNPSGKWIPIRQYDNSEEKIALAFVNYLNGGHGHAWN